MSKLVMVKVGDRIGSRTVISIRWDHKTMDPTHPYGIRRLRLQCDCGTKSWRRVGRDIPPTCATCASTARRRITINVGDHIKSRVVIAIKRGGHQSQIQLQCATCDRTTWVPYGKKQPDCGFCVTQAMGRKHRILKRVGARIGMRTITAIRTVQGYQQWRVRCDCGAKRWLHASKTRLPRCQNCFCWNRKTIPIGTRFGGRTVIAIRIKGKATSAEQYLLMQCDCGKKTWGTAYDITHNHASHCRSCALVLCLNLYRHPNLTQKELQEILELSILKKSLTR